MSQSTTPTGPGQVTPLRAAAYDVVMVAVFLMFGTASHDSTAEGAGHVALLAVSFAVALAVGWGVARAWRTPARIWPTAVVIWLVTVVAGIALRAVIVPGAGFAWTFALVTAGFLGLTLLGWRALASVPPRKK